MKQQRWGLIVLVAVISFVTGGWLLQRGVASGGNVYQQARLFDDVLGHVSAYYVDSIGETDLYDRATRGMLEQLKDPYSVLLTGDDYKALTEQTSGNYAGLGIQIDVRDGWITVVAPLPDTPAERAGVAGHDVRRRRGIHLAQPGRRDVGRGAPVRDRRHEVEGDEVPHPRSPAQPGRTARTGRQGGGSVPRSETGDRGD